MREGCGHYPEIFHIVRAYREDIGQSSLYALIFLRRNIVIEEKEVLLTRKEMCSYLNICLSCVDRLDIPRMKIGRSVRFRKSDVDNWLSEHKSRESKPAVVNVRRSLRVGEAPWQ